MTAEIINWTGHVLITSRQGLGAALKRPEASRTGVYFLMGEDPIQPTRMKVYIGEGDIVGDRLKTHAGDEAKDFWTRACFVTSKDSNITKAHVRYLECRLLQLARESDRSNLANGNEPSTKALPESEVADMEFFLEQIQLILPVVGFDFLRPKPILHAQSPIAQQSAASSSQIELVTSQQKSGLEAHAVATMSGEIIVLAGSRALTEAFSSNGYGWLRQELIDEGKLIHEPNSSLLRFVEDVSFASPSAAAAVVYNRNTNGRTAWKIKGTETTLKEWQDAQLPTSDVEDESFSINRRG